MLRRSLVIVALAAVAAGCNGGGATAPAIHTGVTAPTATPTPTPTPTPAQHLYVGNDNTPGGIRQYSLPLTAASVANFTIASNNVTAVALDASGNLAAGDFAGNLTYFAAPLSGTSTPAAAFKNGAAVGNGQIAFTTAGAFWVATEANSVNQFTPPFSNASTPSGNVTNAALVTSLGTAFDTAQNLYISNAGTGATVINCTSGIGTCSDLVVYAPPYTGAPIITPNIATTAYRKIAVSSTQLFATSVAGATGKVDVYTLPITATSTPAFQITTGVNDPEAVALDASGNLYIGNVTNATIAVYAPPFSANSAPTLSLQVSTGAFAIFGIAIGK
jgi:hypothetical protein